MTRIDRSRVEILRRSWSPAELFGSVERVGMRLSQNDLERLRLKFWKDLYTEYDARHLQAEIERRQIAQTTEAQSFLEAWDADERRHTDGFVRIMELTSEASPLVLWGALDARKHDFTSIERYLQDEFTMLFLIAFDEMVTCHAYAEDRSFYRALGHPAYVTWLRELMADEAAHCRNAIKVIQFAHAHRLPEVRSLAAELANAEASAAGYSGTFVLDHFGEHYTSTMLARCGAALTDAILRPVTLN